MKKYKYYLKLVAFTMISQALIYFLIKLFINDYNIINTFINIPIIKPFVYIYNLWYPFIIINTFLIYKYDKKIFNYLIVTMLIGAFLSHLTFIIYPTMIVRPTIEIKNITDWILNITYKSDTPAVNCLPSMHCVYCFVTSFYILKCKSLNKKTKIIIIIFSLLIVLSTLFIKQHIIEDILLALMYATISIILVCFNKNKINKLFVKYNI